MLKLINAHNFLRFSLIFVLVGSLRHVAWGFGTLETDPGAALFWGYFQAVAIDLAIVALAYGIAWRKREGLATGWYWVGIVGFVVVSVYANLLYGLVFSRHIPDSEDWPGLTRWMIYGRPFLLSGVLPVMLVYVSHIIAADHNRSGKRTRIAFEERVTRVQVDGILDDWTESNGSKTPRVGWLQQEFRRLVGRELPAEAADRAILEWRSAHGVVGRRPQENGIEEVS